MKKWVIALSCALCVNAFPAMADEPKLNFETATEKLYYDTGNKTLALPFADDGDKGSFEMFIKNNTAKAFEENDQFHENRFDPMIGVKFRIKLN